MSIAQFFRDLVKPDPAGDLDAPPATSPATPADPPAGDASTSDIDADQVGGESVSQGDPNGTPPPAGDLDGDGGDLDGDGGDLDGDGGDLDGDGGDLDGDVGDLDGAAAHVEALARRLHAELVRRDGRVADPADIEFDPAHLDDEAALTTAIDEAVESRPAIRSRQYGGDIGAGNRGRAPAAPVDLITLMRDSQ